MTATRTVSRIALEEYAPLLGEPEVAEMRALAKPLKGRQVQMVNSTAVGGGVAEILNRLIPLAEELEIDIHWDVMKGGADFFEVTKSFHNALHGGTYASNAEDFAIFREYNRRNFDLVRHDAEFTIIHDPQPAGLIEARREKAGHWIWRCHIDLSRPNSAVWNFLQPYVSQYDGAIFSSPEFSRQLPVPQYLFYPSIDPLSEKNKQLDASFAWVSFWAEPEPAVAFLEETGYFPSSPKVAPYLQNLLSALSSRIPNPPPSSIPVILSRSAKPSSPPSISPAPSSNSKSKASSLSSSAMACACLCRCRRVSA